MKCVMTVPTTQYATASPHHGAHDLVGGAAHRNSKLPDSPQRMPTKLTSVTTAFSRPIDREIV
jgi:hypothetical protein